jgi:hypothetical protein
MSNKNMTPQNSKPRFRPVIRVFVSSTFSDLKPERNALQAQVFPRLEQLCAQNGFQFQAIDLRWGVSSEAGLDHRTMRICFDELRRAQEISPRPNFLILLGNRYGWRPLPEEISVKEFEELKKAATADVTDDTDKQRSEVRDQRSEIRTLSAIREIREIRGQSLDPLAVLGAWYRRDENAVPPVYLLQSRRQQLPDAKDYKQAAPWNEVQAILWEIINRAQPPEQLRGRFDAAAQAEGSPPAIVRFQASATEQEIWHGALRVLDAREHVLAFFRQIENVGEFSEPAQIKDFVDLEPSWRVDAALGAEQERLKKELRMRLGKANVFEARAALRVSTTDSQGQPTTDVTTDHLAQLGADVENRLTQIIRGQIEEYWNKTTQASTERAARELKIEQDEHERFGRERGGADSFVGRQTELQTILDYLKDDSPWPLVVHGASGCGKTALLARAAEEMQKSEVRGQKPEVIVRFIGVTPRSSDLRSLLGSLCQELRLRHPREGELPTDIKALGEELHEHFRSATPEQPLILFLDALDQLSDAENGRLLNWLPTGQLPPHVKLVVSCLSDRAKDDPAGQPFAELTRRQLPAKNIVNLDALSEVEASTLLFDRWLHQAGRTVSREQRERIEQRLASPVCRQPIYLKLLFEESRLWRSYDAVPELGESVSAILGQLFERLGRPANHGRLLVERVLGYLAASRHGLAENEILEVLFADPEYKAALDQATEQTRHELPASATRIPIAIWSRLRFDLAPYLTERAAPGANVLTFYHRQVAEWVPEYLAKMPSPKWPSHKRLADYFRNLADPESNQSWTGDSPRPFLEVAFHLAGAQRLDEACQTLCDLRFVEARCRLNQVFELIADYRLAQENLPEAQADLREELAREECVRRWTAEIIDYARQWSNRRDRLERGESVTEPEPKLPEPVPTCEMWSEEKIQAECERIIQSPTRRDRLEAFAGFVSGECYPLLEYGKRPGFVLQHAFNTEPAGAVHDAAAWLKGSVETPVLLRRWPPGSATKCKPALLRTLVGHTDDVLTVVASANGRLAISGSRDETLRVWDLESGQSRRNLTGHSAFVTSLSITPDGRRAVSANWDKTLRVWDPENGYCLSTLVGHSEGVSSVSVTPDGRRAVSGSHDNTLRVWDLVSGKCLLILVGHRCGVTGVGVTPDGRRAVSASIDNTLRLWDLDNGQCLRVLAGHTNPVNCVCVTPDGRHAVSGSHDNTLRFWDLENGQCLCILVGLRQGVTSVSMTPDAQFAISASWDNTIRVWDLKNGQCLRTLEGHTSDI